MLHRGGATFGASAVGAFMSGLVMARVLYVGLFPAYAAFSEEIQSIDGFFYPFTRELTTTSLTPP